MTHNNHEVIEVITFKKTCIGCVFLDECNEGLNTKDYFERKNNLKSCLDKFKIYKFSNN